jgi:hypothetical protein
MAMTTHKKISLRGVKASPFHEWEPLLHCWQKLNSSYAKHFAAHKEPPKRDVAWRHGERTAVGIFAAAVWIEGGKALQEYPIRKKYSSKKKREPKRSGAGDLRFYFRKNLYVAEAKLKELNLTKKNLHNKNKKAYPHLGKAWHDSLRTPRRGAKRVGMLFLVPRFVDPPNDRIIKQWLTDLLKQLEKKKIAMAWTFPSVALKVPWKSKTVKSRYYPGVVLLLKPPRA